MQSNEHPGTKDRKGQNEIAMQRRASLQGNVSIPQLDGWLGLQRTTQQFPSLHATGPNQHKRSGRCLGDNFTARQNNNADQ
jgi:hypothetical protein